MAYPFLKNLRKVGHGDLFWLLKMKRRPYMFYPAHFWPHKNHRMLFTALSMFLSRKTGKKIDLVLAGALGNIERDLKYEARKMGLAKRVHFLGYMSRNDISNVMGSCDFIISPSLYEVFGDHLIEAMSLGKPILCSDINIFREIADNAALYFDPRKPEEIAQRLERITSEPKLVTSLVTKGRRRLKQLLHRKKSRHLLPLSDFGFENSAISGDLITGIFQDGWTNGEIAIHYESGTDTRVLEIRLEAPLLLPKKRVRVELREMNELCKEYMIYRGDELTIRHNLIEKEGTVNILISPLFRPSEDIVDSLDMRFLGLKCSGCWLISPEKVWTSLLKKKSRLSGQIRDSYGRRNPVE